MAFDWSSLQWSRTSQSKAERKANKAAPPPDPTPYTRPNPLGRSAPYVAANFDYADNPQSPNYAAATGGRKRWRNRRISQGGETFVAPSGTYPAAGHEPDDWHGYTRDNYWDSLANEHVVNADEGNPPVGYKRYHPALNPYWYKIPDSRPVRTVHEYDFRRSYDGGLDGQHKVPARHLTGDVYAAGNIGMTAQPSAPLKGMTPARRRRTTHRIEPVEWGEDRAMSSSGYAPGEMYASNFAIGSGYAL